MDKVFNQCSKSLWKKGKAEKKSFIEKRSEQNRREKKGQRREILKVFPFFVQFKWKFYGEQMGIEFLKQCQKK
jgi:hypothetical protein